MVTGKHMDFKTAKAQANELWEQSSSASRALNEFLDKHPKGAMGLTPDSVKSMPEFKKLDDAYKVAASRLRTFNSAYTKTFAKEIRSERAKRFSKLNPIEDTKQIDGRPNAALKQEGLKMFYIMMDHEKTADTANSLEEARKKGQKICDEELLPTTFSIYDGDGNLIEDIKRTDGRTLGQQVSDFNNQAGRPRG